MMASTAGAGRGVARSASGRFAPSTMTSVDCRPMRANTSRAMAAALRALPLARVEVIARPQVRGDDEPDVDARRQQVVDELVEVVGIAREVVVDDHARARGAGRGKGLPGRLAESPRAGGAVGRRVSRLGTLVMSASFVAASLTTRAQLYHRLTNHPTPRVSRSAPRVGGSAGLAHPDALEVRVREAAVGVEALEHGARVGEPRVHPLHRRAVEAVQLAPVRPGVERLERRLDAPEERRRPRRGG